MIEKILERLEVLHDLVKDNQKLAVSQAISIVQEVAKEYGNGWIPCSERMPEKTGNYLVSSKGTIWVANWFNDTWWGIEKRCRWTDIEAWRPLPAPYQKGE